ncbi:MAG: glycoside hydrolase family 16 protein [Cryomorphaceae bacterium]
MYKYITSFRSLALISLALVGCKEDPEPSVQLPSNLQISAEVVSEGEGRVNVNASASLANFYTFIFEESGELTYLDNTEGAASYVYQTSGTFPIIVRANTTHDDYIEALTEVTVTLNDEVLGNGGNPPTSGYTTPLTYEGFTLVWNDEFNGSNLSSDWNQEIGTGSSGWGNNELQYYRAENSSVSDGFLTIEAREESYNGNSYTSSRITTQNKQSFRYGRIDIRAALPYGKGLWPALWMLGTNIPSVGWPSCGEIDIMEMVGGNVSGGGNHVTHGTVHWDNNGQHASFGGSKALSEGSLADKFHVYTIIWDSLSIEWYLDDQKFHTIDISSSGLDAFKEEFFFIFNVAVGGNWPGSPNSSTTFPQFMFVDYVRVFQK